MQAEVPVIISLQSGVSEILKNVIKVDYWDVHFMADAICDLLNDQTLGNKLRKKGKEEIKTLIWEKSASNVRKIYLRLLDKFALEQLKQ